MMKSSNYYGISIESNMINKYIYILHQTDIEKDKHIELSKQTGGELTRTRRYNLSEVRYL